MFLLVMALTFFAALFVSKGRDNFEMKKLILEEQEVNSDVKYKDEEVYIIDNKDAVENVDRFSTFDQHVDHRPVCRKNIPIHYF